ncbi:MAG: hypothetical protein ACT4OF_06900 [Caulobacteraceae bacterium]
MACLRTILLALVSCCLAVAGFFSSRLLITAPLTVALFTTNWLDYGHSGFLGKLIAYPGALFLFGLLAAFARQGIRPAHGAILAVLARAVATMHTPDAAALIYLAFAAPFFNLQSPPSSLRRSRVRMRGAGWRSRPSRWRPPPSP